MSLFTRYTMVGCLLLTASLAAADTIWILPGPPSGIKADNIRIEKIEGGELYYDRADGAKQHKPLDRIALIVVNDNANFTAAEKAFFDKNFEDASELYSQAVSATDKDWIKLRCAKQLEVATAKSNRFDLKSLAWIQSVMAGAKPEELTRPPLPAADSKYLDLTADKINQALNTPNISEAKQSTLMLFLLDIYQLKKDPRADQLRKTLERLTSGSTTVSPSARAGLVLSNIHEAMEAGKFDKVVSEIQSNKAIFTELEQQVDALYCLAEAQNALAKESTDANALKDVGLAYMRVVANGKDLATRPAFVADALYKTGLIHERLKEPQTAVAIYKQAIEQFPDSPAAGKAKQRVKALNPKPPQP